MWMFLLASLALASDPDGDHQLLPSHVISAADAAAWPEDDGWWTGPPRSWLTGGTRMGALLSDGDPALRIQVRGVDGDRRGPWVDASETWGGDRESVQVAELGGWYPAAQIRVDDPAAIGRLAWEIRIPVDEPRAPASSGPRPPSISAALQAIGVISREEWGANSTTCSTLEDDWYRVAIHHTAGSQTSGGTVQGSVQALQAYAMGSGGYCDIPYQFVVGYDGSLWEGRPLTYYSGATYNNNDGNIAVCFLGCYDVGGCSDYDPATDEMIVWARLLIQTLAIEHAFTTTTDTLLGHGDWPDNATACPGDQIKPRIDELRQADAPYQGSLSAVSDGAVEVGLGEQVEVWFEIENTGTETWSPGETWLAPLPRDEASPWAGDDWGSSGRAATVDAEVSPGEIGVFAFSIYGAEEGTETLSFGLVQEWVTWFEDIPWGGGPAEGELLLTVEGVEGSGGGGGGGGGSPSGDDTGSSGGGGDGGSPGDEPLSVGPSFERVPFYELGCASHPAERGAGPAGAWLALLGALLIRRRA